MNTKLPTSVTERKLFVQTMLRYRVLPTARNFLPLTYDMKEAFFGNIVGSKTMYVFMPIDTSHMSVLSILEAEERIIKERKKGSLYVVSEEERDEMTAASMALNQMLREHENTESLITDKEKIEFLLSHYSELNNWLMEEPSSEKGD